MSIDNSEVDLQDTLVKENTNTADIQETQSDERYDVKSEDDDVITGSNKDTEPHGYKADDNDVPEIVTELFAREHNIETKRDEQFEIRGLAATKWPGNILVCDHGNCCIKYLDYQFNIVQRYTVVYEPWDVCVLDDTYIVVTFPFVRLLQYLKFKNTTKIVPWFPIKSQNEYYGVCGDHDTIIAICKYDDSTESRDPALHVMDRNGNVKLVIDKNGNGENIFTDPNYIDLDPSTQVLYVSDQGSKQVISCSMSGRFLARFSVADFQPMGLSVNISNGNIFVANNVSVILFDRNLRKLQKLKCKGDSMNDVSTVLHCSRSDRLIVCMESSPLVRVFTM